MNRLTHVILVSIFAMILSGATRPPQVLAWTGPDYFTGNAGILHSLSNVGDLNGDGYQDLAYGNALQSTVWVCYGSANGISLGQPDLALVGIAGEQFGEAVCTAGDLNGDGFGDLIVGAPSHDILYRPNCGAIFIYLGSANGIAEVADFLIVGPTTDDAIGKKLAYAGDVDDDGFDDILAYSASFGYWECYQGNSSGLGSTPVWNAGILGSAANGAGDVNADGYDDVILGDGSNAGVGRVYIYLGSSNGLLDFFTSTMTPDAQGAAFGASVSSAGDINGDGYADVVVGDPFASQGVGQNFGRATAFYGNSGGVSPVPVWSRWGDRDHDQYGKIVFTAGDYNGDGYSDIMVGAPNWDSPLAEAGRLDLFWGSSGGLSTTPSESYQGLEMWQSFGSLITCADINGDGFNDIFAYQSTGGGKLYGFAGRGASLGSQDTWTVYGAAGEKAGKSVAMIGDVNGDGYADAAVGLPEYNGFQGNVKVYYGSSTGLSVVESWGKFGNAAGDQFGTAIAAAGDVNGDGYGDLLIGAPGVSNNQGVVYLYFGSAGGLGMFSDVTLSGTSGSFGLAAAGAGDINGDGYGDVVVGSPFLTGWNGGPRYNMGLVQVFLGAPAGPPTTPSWEWSSGLSGTRTGTSVSAAGDVNGDGFGDILVGQPGLNGGDGSALCFLGEASGPAATPVWTINGQSGSLEALGSVVAGVGDLDRDGYADAAIGIPTAAGGGRVEYYEGWSQGLKTSPTTTVTGNSTGDRLGQSVAGLGDVNGDGYGDSALGVPGLDKVEIRFGGALGVGQTADAVITGLSGSDFGFALGGGDVDGDGYSDLVLGAPLADIGGTNTGQAFCYLGNGRVSGVPNPVIPRQLDNGFLPIAPLGRSDSANSFLLAMRGRSSVGRTNLRLEKRVAPVGSLLQWQPVEAGLWLDTGSPGPTGSDAELTTMVTGLTGNTQYHWQLRSRSDSPYFATTPWFTINGGAQNLAHLRTNGAPLDPNLVVTEISPTSANDSSPVTVSITVANLGLVASGATTTSVSLDGVTTCAAVSTPSIPALEQVVVTCQLGTPSGGQHVVESCADAGDTETESDEWDNCLQVNLLITTNPVLTLTADGSGDVPTIADALALISPGGVILLGDGIYSGTGNRDLVLDARTVTIRSVSGDSTACVIDLQGSASDPHHGFRLTNGTVLNLDRLTLRNGYAVNGAAMSVNTSTLNAQGCIFESSETSNAGGAINFLNAGGRLDGCRFTGNRTIYAGGALYLNNSAPVISMCLFDGNHADNWGGAVHGQNPLSVFELASCTFARNDAPQGSSIYVRGGSAVSLGNTLIAFGTGSDPVWNNGGDISQVSCCDVFGNAVGDYVGALAGFAGVNDNFSSDPLFCDEVGGNYNVLSGSPCSEAGNPGCGLIGAFEAGCGFVITVTPDGSGDQPTIQAALNVALPGDIVELLNGVYTGTGNRDLNFQGKAITLRGQSQDASLCILDCQASDTDRHHGVDFLSGETTATVLEHITITGANKVYGGAININNASSPTIRHCILRDNTSGSGAGILIGGGSNPLLSNIRFENNTATNAGGGIYINSSFPSISDCVFTGNHGRYGGGGIFNQYASPNVLRSVFTGNTSDYWGGAVHNRYSTSAPNFTDCLMTGNSAPEGGAVYDRDGATPSYMTCTFSGNSSPDGGAIKSLDGSMVSLVRCIVAFSSQGAAVSSDGTSTFTAFCSDIFGNAGGDYTGPLAGQLGTNDNISSDPLFCDANSGDFSLNSTSPCQPVNSECGLLIGVYGTGCAMSAVDDLAGAIPSRLTMGPASPNPFNPLTVVRYQLPTSGKVRMEVFDLGGRRVATLVNEDQVAGRHEVTWQAMDDGGRGVSSGVYLVRLKLGPETIVQKITLTK